MWMASCMAPLPGGGKYNDGTVFSITLPRKEKVLYSFGPSPDGAAPGAPLTNVNGTLYGTTYEGGAYSQGTVFSVTTQGAENVLHRFTGYPDDGARPVAGLVYMKGVLYGTTTTGGSNNIYNDFGAGTVFSITPSGTENVLYSFAGGSDGVSPAGGLLDVKGTLYGTTTEGGAHGCGTIFKITKAGAEKIIHSFYDAPDGCSPNGGLLDVKGTLYGTTAYGGSYHGGGGTVFRVTATDKERVLHSFGFESDGSNPLAGLTELNGILYGTTDQGGAYGEGTVFAFKP